MFNLGPQWIERLLSQPETGMGYQVVRIETRDGRVFDDVMIVGGAVVSIAGDPALPFCENDVRDIQVTHGR